MGLPGHVPVSLLWPTLGVRCGLLVRLPFVCLSRHSQPVCHGLHVPSTKWPQLCRNKEQHGPLSNVWLYVMYFLPTSVNAAWLSTLTGISVVALPAFYGLQAHLDTLAVVVVVAMTCIGEPRYIFLLVSCVLVGKSGSRYIAGDSEQSHAHDNLSVRLKKSAAVYTAGKLTDAPQCVKYPQGTPRVMLLPLAPSHPGCCLPLVFCCSIHFYSLAPCCFRLDEPWTLNS